MEAKLKKLLISGLICLLVIPAGSLAGPGQAVVTDRLPNQPPENCISNPDRPDALEPDVVGSVTRVNDSQLRVSYELANQNASLKQFRVRLRAGATLVNKTGFEESTFASGQYWKANAENHELVYEMRPVRTGSHRVSYPSGGDWILASTPQHFGAQVNLTAEKEGYIGGNTLYLGEYSTEREEAGCQEFVAIVPKSVRFGDVSTRLDELTTAAQSLPVGNQYRTVRIFVSPEQPGDAYGFVMWLDNEIVVVDRTAWRPTSTVWIHEYIHTVQGFRPKPNMSWFYEASAEYLSLRIAVEHGYIRPAEYDYLLGEGAQEFDMSMVASPQRDVAYQRGAVVLSQLDLELHETHNQSVVSMLQEMNSKQNPGQSDVVRWLQDDIGMSGNNARHTINLVNNNEQLNPPLISSVSEFIWPRRLLYALSRPVSQLLCGFFGGLLLANGVYIILMGEN